jgi:aminoglycoside phosphotransferase family enzyme/predicted kinase
MWTTDGQAEIVAALAEGRAIDEDGPTKRIDTPMSHIFLGRSRAFKLKRDCLLPFVDFSSLAARHRACEAELAVNAKLAGDLYEGVSPVIRQPDGRLRVGGLGPALDWVVVMKRFPDGALLDDLAKAGRLTPDMVRQVAETVARFHQEQPAVLTAGHAVDYRHIVEGLRRTEAEAAAALDLSPGSEELFTELERHIAELSPMIEARRRAGWVRRGHGDLHLRNICLFRGRVTPFDALEFDPALATADVIYDLAFLLMDLRARGLTDLANIAMNHYWDQAALDEEALALLPMFMALRAAVRLAVALETGDLVEAARYRALGLDLLKTPHLRLLAIGGLSGSGKSTLAQTVAPDLPGPCGGRLLRSDLIRKAMRGARQDERLGPEAYEPEARATIYKSLTSRADHALKAGSSVLVDATFREAHARAAVESLTVPAQFTGLWLRADKAVRAARVTARQNDASDATAVVALTQVEPAQLGAAWRVVDAGGALPALISAVRRALAETDGRS